VYNYSKQLTNLYKKNSIIQTIDNFSNAFEANNNKEIDFNIGQLHSPLCWINSIKWFGQFLSSRILRKGTYAIEYAIELETLTDASISTPRVNPSQNTHT